ncbi:MAG: class I SAM-dependent methyltransferase [Candidatus Bathyarchaeia archaeon]
MTEDAIQSFYDKEAEVYDGMRFKSSHGAYVDYFQKSAVLELIGYCKGMNILEIGSGTGRFTRELVKRGAHVVCVDLSRNMHSKSKQSVPNDSVDYFVMSGLDLGFDDESFDVCLTVNMMSHIKDYSAVFAEVNRVLKKRGFFVANFPNVAGIYFPVGCFVNFFQRSLQVPVYSRWYSMRTIFRSLRCAGLSPVHTIGHMIFPKKYCPKLLFICLKEVDLKLANSRFWSVAGDLFILSCKF